MKWISYYLILKQMIIMLMWKTINSATFMSLNLCISYFVFFVLIIFRRFKLSFFLIHFLLWYTKWSAVNTPNDIRGETFSNNLHLIHQIRHHQTRYHLLYQGGIDTLNFFCHEYYLISVLKSRQPFIFVFVVILPCICKMSTPIWKFLCCFKINICIFGLQYIISNKQIIHS